MSGAHASGGSAAKWQVWHAGSTASGRATGSWPGRHGPLGSAIMQKRRQCWYWHRQTCPAMQTGCLLHEPRPPSQSLERRCNADIKQLGIPVRWWTATWPQHGERHCSVFPFPACTNECQTGQGANVSSARRFGPVLLFLLPAPETCGQHRAQPRDKKVGLFWGARRTSHQFKSESKAVLQLA